MTIVAKTLNLAAVGTAVRLELDSDQPTQALMINTLSHGKSYEATFTDLMMRILAPGDAMIEVGAHVGYVSVIAAALVGPTGRVVAVEPNPANFERLSHHKALNRLDQLVLHHAAASAAVGTATFHLNADNDGGHALWDVRRHADNAKSRAAPQAITVPTVTVDSLAGAIGERRLRLIKVDTEGAEHLVLSGARETLAAARDLLVVAELNDLGLRLLGEDQVSLRSLMRGLGYETFRMPVGVDLPVWIPEATRIVSDFVENLLFARPETIGGLWPAIRI